MFFYDGFTIWPLNSIIIVTMAINAILFTVMYFLIVYVTKIVSAYQIL